jgi:hypothetical protein
MRKLPWLYVAFLTVSIILIVFSQNLAGPPNKRPNLRRKKLWPEETPTLDSMVDQFKEFPDSVQLPDNLSIKSETNRLRREVDKIVARIRKTTSGK